MVVTESFRGHPILANTMKRASWLTRSKAFVRLIKAPWGGKCCSLHFSIICRRVKIISEVKPLCESEYTILGMWGGYIQYEQRREIHQSVVVRMTLELRMSWPIVPAFQKKITKGCRRVAWYRLITSDRMLPFPGAFPVLRQSSSSSHCEVHAVMQNLGFDQSHLVIGWHKVALLLNDTPKNVFCNAKLLAGAKELEEFVSNFVDLAYSKFSKVWCPQCKIYMPNLCVEFPKDY